MEQGQTPKKEHSINLKDRKTLEMTGIKEVDSFDSEEFLLETVLGVEHELGRVRNEVWGPRSIDIDVLLYEDLELQLTDLKVPHPEMHLRSFVIDPLNEIAPKREHPTLHMTVEKIKDKLDKSQSAE